MSLYEHVFLTRQDVSAQQVETLTETFTGVIAEGGGQVEKTEYWGLKSLTFRVKKNRKAHFTLMNIDAPHAAVAEMERQMALSEDIIRFLTLKVDEHEAGPSAMMRSRGGRDRDDRRGRRGDGRPPREEGRSPRESEEKSGDSEKPAEAPAGPPAEAAATEAPSKTPAEAAATEAPSETPAEAAPTEAPSETPAEAAATETPSQTPAEAADAAPAAEEEAKS